MAHQEALQRVTLKNPGINFEGWVLTISREQGVCPVGLSSRLVLKTFRWSDQVHLDKEYTALIFSPGSRVSHFEEHVL